MKLSYLEASGFRGYKETIRIDFADSFTVIDGRNGVGKSTVFDAIEFALTGKLSKYDDLKAAGETFSDYVWWRGDSPAPLERYVKLGFRDADGELSITRREFDEPDQKSLEELLERICDKRLSPIDPLNQLCTNAIIRDEHITKLSLDLKEADRYTLLRDALGANDADHWIERGAKVLAAAKKKVALATQEVIKLGADVATASRRLDEVRARLTSSNTIAESIKRLQTFIGSAAPQEQLFGVVVEKIALLRGEIDSLVELGEIWPNIQKERLQLQQLKKSLDEAKLAKESADKLLADIQEKSEPNSTAALAESARDLVTLIELGKKIGLRDGHCPLCAAGQSHEDFYRGIENAERFARQINETAARFAQWELLRNGAQTKVIAANQSLEIAESAQKISARKIEQFEEKCRAYRLPKNATAEEIKERINSNRLTLESIQNDFRVLETLKLNEELERAIKAEADAKARLLKSQEKVGKARKAESIAQALHDAARRASSETLDLRLERVLPLMSELYRRLRPHPVWADIEYSIRGDVWASPVSPDTRT